MDAPSDGKRGVAVGNNVVNWKINNVSIINFLLDPNLTNPCLFLSGMRSRPPSAVQLHRLHSVSDGHVPGQLFSVIITQLYKWNRFHLYLIWLSFLLHARTLRRVSIYVRTHSYRGNCKSCPKKLTTCFMGARQCTDCKPPEECSAPVQRIPGADTAQSSKLATPARRKHLQRIRQQQNRQRQNATTTSSNTRRRVWNGYAILPRRCLHLFSMIIHYFQVSFFVNLWFVPWRPSFKWSIVTHRIYIIFVDIKQTKVIAPSSRKQPIDLCTLCFIFLTCSTCWRMAFPFLWIKDVIAFLRNFLTKKIIRKQHPIEQINIKTNRHQRKCLSNRLCPAIVGILTGPVSLVLLLFVLAIFFSKWKFLPLLPIFKKMDSRHRPGKWRLRAKNHHIL